MCVSKPCCNTPIYVSNIRVNTKKHSIPPTNDGYGTFVTSINIFTYHNFQVIANYVSMIEYIDELKLSTHSAVDFFFFFKSTSISSLWHLILNLFYLKLRIILSIQLFSSELEKYFVVALPGSVELKYNFVWMIVESVILFYIWDYNTSTITTTSRHTIIKERMLLLQTHYIHYTSTTGMNLIAIKTIVHTSHLMSSQKYIYLVIAFSNMKGHS